MARSKAGFTSLHMDLNAWVLDAALFLLSESLCIFSNCSGLKIVIDLVSGTDNKSIVILNNITASLSTIAFTATRRIHRLELSELESCPENHL